MNTQIELNTFNLYLHTFFSNIKTLKYNIGLKCKIQMLDRASPRVGKDGKFETLVSDYIVQPINGVTPEQNIPHIGQRALTFRHSQLIDTISID